MQPFMSHVIELVERRGRVFIDRDDTGKWVIQVLHADDEHWAAYEHDVLEVAARTALQDVRKAAGDVSVHGSQVGTSRKWWVVQRASLATEGNQKLGIINYTHESTREPLERTMSVPLTAKGTRQFAEFVACALDRDLVIATPKEWHAAVAAIQPGTHVMSLRTGSYLADLTFELRGMCDAARSRRRSRAGSATST